MTLRYTQLFQTIADIFFAYLRSPASVFGLLPQQFFRTYHVFYMFDYCNESWAITWCVATWSFVEMLRFTFYMYKSGQKGLMGDLRYNAFLIMYPLGGLGEALAAN